VRTPTRSNDSGYYTINFLPIGEYELVVSHPGFRGYTRKGIALTTGQTLELNVTLELGAVTEEALELGLVGGGGDDQDLGDPGQHERGQRVVDHRFVVDGHQLLADGVGDRIQPGARTPGQDDALHSLAFISHPR
jgi:hypothetical protein